MCLNFFTFQSLLVNFVADRVKKVQNLISFYLFFLFKLISVFNFRQLPTTFISNLS